MQRHIAGEQHSHDSQTLRVRTERLASIGNCLRVPVFGSVPTCPGNGCVQNYPSCLEANFLIAASFWPTTQELPRPGNSR